MSTRINVERVGVVRMVTVGLDRRAAVEVEFHGSPLPQPYETVFFSPSGFDDLLGKAQSDLAESKLSLEIALRALDATKSDLAAMRSSLRFGRVLAWAAVTLAWLVVALAWVVPA